ncbi:uncharacterized protein [Dermacentor andersoni]|uniref:uncharacterized protein isoform X1 n=1 Tax=Dermacentor andersoni TaxID=34620 RepID=UPI003B3AB76F
MTRVLVAGDSMVKYADQYFPSRRSLSVSVAAHRGVRIEHLLSMIADKLAGFDVVIVHVGTNNAVDSVSVCMDRYRQLAQGIIERNPMVHVAFSAILPRGQNQYSSWEAQSSWLHDLNGNYKRINSALMQYCHECGYTFLGGLVDNWPSCLSRDGVHPSRFGNKVLADFLYQGACTLSIHLERSRIQQSYKETQAPSSWTSWTRQDSIPAISEADFPPLDRWCKDHFLSDSCMVSSATPVVTSSIQLLPSVKLDTAQEKSTDVPAACIHTTIKSSGASVPLSKYYTIV